MIRTKRVYDPPSADDGYRVLVDRLWPRGVSKERAALGVWLRDAAPSTELRKWYGHDPARFEEFKSRYETELAANPAVAKLRDLVRDHPQVTLLYGARSPQNEAEVLRSFLERR